MKQILILFSLVVLMFSGTEAFGQLDTSSSVFGKGIRLVSRDSSFYIKFGFRIQPHYAMRFTEAYQGDQSITEQRLVVRRSRLKFDGWVMNPKLVYKFEYDLVGGYIRDAAIKWNFAGKFNLWFGQAKLPGNRQRVVSSQKLNLVERSMANLLFNIDRDVGFQLHHKFDVGGTQFKWALALSQGDGILSSRRGEGFEYTARLEWLPFGKFKKKGDYFEADLAREPKPKLAIGATYDLNQRANFDRGSFGTELGQARDLEAVFVDAIFKYRGFSLLTEYLQKRSTNGSPGITDTTGNVLESFITGYGMNFQAGYVFKCNWEVVGRYSFADYQFATKRGDQAEYTMGVSKYILGHSLKVQTDASYITTVGSANRWRYRFQMELAF